MWYGLGFHSAAPRLQSSDSRTYPVFSRGQRHAKNSLWEQWRVAEETVSTEPWDAGSLLMGRVSPVEKGGWDRKRASGSFALFTPTTSKQHSR